MITSIKPFTYNSPTYNKYNSVTKNKVPSFGSIDYRPTTFYEDGYIISSQNTTCIRGDLDNRKLAKILKNHFKDKEKINILPMNCSDGTECYALAIAIINEFGLEEAKKKIFPILASDVDSWVINNFGRNGFVVLDKVDISAFGQKNIEKYFNKLEKSEVPLREIMMDYEDGYKLKAKPEFKDLFTFHTENFNDRLAKLKDNGNSVVMIRNCLYQAYGYAKSQFIIIKVKEKLRKGSMFIIGETERVKMPRLITLITNNGDFTEIEHNVFLKNKDPMIHE